MREGSMVSGDAQDPDTWRWGYQGRLNADVINIHYRFYFNTSVQVELLPAVSVHLK